MFELGASAIHEAVDQGIFATDDPDLASLTMWASIQGVCGVLLLGFAPDEDLTERLIESVIDSMIAGQIHPLAER